MAEKYANQPHWKIMLQDVSPLMGLVTLVFELLILKLV